MDGENLYTRVSSNELPLLIFRSFFGRIEDTINCFRDLLTFNPVHKIIKEEVEALDEDVFSAEVNQGLKIVETFSLAKRTKLSLTPEGIEVRSKPMEIIDESQNEIPNLAVLEIKASIENSEKSHQSTQDGSNSEDSKLECSEEFSNGNIDIEKNMEVSDVKTEKSLKVPPEISAQAKQNTQEGSNSEDSKLECPEEFSNGNIGNQKNMKVSDVNTEKSPKVPPEISGQARQNLQEGSNSADSKLECLEEFSNGNIDIEKNMEVSDVKTQKNLKVPPEISGQSGQAKQNEFKLLQSGFEKQAPIPVSMKAPTPVLTSMQKQAPKILVKISCTKCGYLLNDEESFIKHVVTVHDESLKNPNQAIIGQPLPNHKPNQASSPIPTPSGYYTSGYYNSKSTSPKSAPRICCAKCSSTFQNESNLNKHIDRFHRCKPTSTIVPTPAFVSTLAYMPTTLLRPKPILRPTSTLRPTSVLRPTPVLRPTSAIMPTTMSMPTPIIMTDEFMPKPPFIPSPVVTWKIPERLLTKYPLGFLEKPNIPPPNVRNAVRVVFDEKKNVESFLPVKILPNEEMDQLEIHGDPIPNPMDQLEIHGNPILNPARKMSMSKLEIQETSETNQVILQNEIVMAENQEQLEINGDPILNPVREISISKLETPETNQVILQNEIAMPENQGQLEINGDPIPNPGRETSVSKLEIQESSETNQIILQNEIAMAENQEHQLSQELLDLDLDYYLLDVERSDELGKHNYLFFFNFAWTMFEIWS